MNRLTNVRISSWWICFFLVLLTGGIYWRAVQFDFVNFDDPDYVFQNRHVQEGLTPDNLIWSFTTGAASNWHPLTWLSLMLDRDCFGAGPGGYHFTNLLLHTLNTLLLFGIFAIMTGRKWPSAFTAALFAVHPLHIESVAWIAERKDVLSTLFWMLTLWCYYGYIRKGGGGRYILTLVIFALGLTAKPMLVTLPLILLLLDYWPLERLQPFRAKLFLRRIWEKAPFLLLSALSSTATFMVQFRGGTVAKFEKISLGIRISNAALSYWRYLGKMIWPANLSFYYPYAEGTGTSPYWLESAAAAAALILLTVFVVYSGRKHRFLTTGWLWYLITLVPVIGLVHVGSQAYANRYTYIPLTGIFIIAAWGIPAVTGRLPFGKAVLTAGALAILAILSILASMEVRYWQNSLTLCRRAVEVDPKNFMAHTQLGQVLYQRGEFEEAAFHLQEAIRYQPDNVYARFNLGLIGIQQKRFDEASQHFREVTRLQASDASGWFFLGFSLMQQGKPNEALGPLQEAVQLNPAMENAHFHLGCAFEQLHKYSEALLHYREAVRLKPENPMFLNGLAWVLATSNQSDIRNPQEAVGLAEKACRLTEHKEPFFLDTLAAACAADGRFPEALKYQQLAIEIAESRNNPSVLEDFKKRLALYQSGQAYRAP